MRCLHVITGLELGGAEQMLAKLLAADEELRTGAQVVGLGPEGPVAARIRALGVEVLCLNVAFSRAALSLPAQMAKLRRRYRPHLVQGWMYHGCWAATWGAKLGARTRVPLVWNIRQSVRLHQEKIVNAGLVLALAALSRLTDAVIYNSVVASRQHQRMGFAASKTTLIPNGFDLDRFRPNPAARPRLRSSLGLAADARLIGMAARFDPMKGHEVFLQAAARLRSTHPQVHFLLAGAGCGEDNAALVRALQRLHLRGHVHCMGIVADLPTWFAGLDLYTSASTMKEGFSNSIAEAMCCGVPCAVTRVGDSSEIVGEAGQVVAPGDPAALCAAWSAMLAAGESAHALWGGAARERISSRFEIHRVARRYAQLYRDLCPRPAARGGE